MSENKELTVPLEKAGLRLDHFLQTEYPEQTRSFLQKLITDQSVLVNGTSSKAGYKLHQNDVICVNVPDPCELEILPEDIPLDIVYEDSDVILINKPKNMVVHPAAGHTSGTLVNALLFHCKDLSGINGVMRPGIVHRIDMDTTGIIIACKNDKAHNVIAKQLKEHSVTRRYYALVHGNFHQEEGKVDAPIGRHPQDRKKMAINHKNGKEAVTHYKVLEQFPGYSLIECRLETGRTHQIRVHMSSIGHPLVGDTVYGNGKSPFATEGQCLHAYILGFHHPNTGEYMEFSTPLPEYFEKILITLRNKQSN